MNLHTLLLRLALGRRLPVTKGTLRLQGVRAPVTIRRDQYSIPHIDAEDDADAWFALGFCQGQDRAFQLELRLRTARGTLSALVGKQTLSIDRLSRRIGFREASLRQLHVLDADVLAQIDAFARGINAGIAQGLRSSAHEFVILRGRPTDWDAADVLAAGKLMSFFLIGNWDVELARLKILTLDGPQALRDLDPSHVDEHDVTPPGELTTGAVRQLDDDLASFIAFAGRAGGSNNWAIAGSKTASGRPILANDPHLEPSLPAHWYLARLTTSSWSVAGASLVGGPAIGAGHNGYAAWGITAGLIDTVDLYVEEIGVGGRSVREGDAFVACETRREVIEVKGGAPVIEDVLITPRGPIIGPALADDVGAISMQALWLQPRPARGFLTAHKARSFEAFRREFTQWPLLNQNVAYADAGGTIGWQLVGEAPIRRKGWGTLPGRGADLDAGWEDSHVPFEAMPYAENPSLGFVATANNKPIRDTDTPYLGVDWLDGYRAERTTEALTARDDWDIASTQRLQLDETSHAWQEIRDAVLTLTLALDDARLAQQLLAAWDGVMAAGSPAATVYELFVADIWQRIAEARAPKSSQWALGKGFTTLLPLTTFALGRTSHTLRLVQEQPDGWFVRGWPAQIEESLAAVVQRLRSERGNDPRSWAWGEMRRLTLKHPLGAITVLAPIFNRGPFVFGGDGSTISQAGVTLNPLGNPLAIASLRMVVDVGDWETARFGLPGGQSGNPLSPHYDDMLPAWQRGDGVSIAWADNAVAAATRDTLRLIPLKQSNDDAGI